MSSPARSGPLGGDPHDGPGGRREAPFGPEISWPYGFRQMDSESRDLIESAYGTGYQQPAMDDYGYGDPGYSDPSYEGPKTPYNGPAFPGSGSGSGSGYGGGSPNTSAPRPLGGSGYRPSGPVPGYHVPGVRDSARPGRSYPPPSGQPDIWPVTGAQEALPDTGPQPVMGRPAYSDGPAYTDKTAYPEQWYDSPRLDGRAAGDGRRGAADPRLAGMTYGELRYDEPAQERPGEPGYDEPLDDESWYQELRRSGPVHPQGPGGAQGPGGPQRRADGPAYGQQPGFGFPPGPDRPSNPSNPSGPPGYGPPRGPQMSAGRQAAPRPGQQPGSPSAANGTGFLAAPVGLLTPPDGTRVDVLRDGFPAATAGATGATGATAGLLAAPDTGRSRRSDPPGVRPGHGLDGPEITSSWPAQPSADDVESFDNFWRDDEDEEYSGLFGDREAEFERAAAKQSAARKALAKRRTGRRRGRSSDHRLWLGLGGVVVVAAAAIAGIVKFEFLPSHSGPVHTMGVPASIGTYARTVGLEKTTDLAALRAEVIRMSSGQATGVVSAVYKSGNSAAGNTEQIIMFIGGHLANADPAASIASFTQKFPGAHVVSAGSLGGEAACVQEGSGSNAVAMCAWFDNDSFGEIVSPTMNATVLARTMLTVRPAVEQVAPK
jgi:hypothetical protein